MQCENGYTKPGVKWILCRKAKEPKENDMRSAAHALCGHQRFCPNARCYTLLPGWEKCVLRDTATAPETREEAAGDEIETQEGKPKGKKKAAKKSAESAEQEVE